AFRFPNTISVSRRMIFKPDEKNLGPEILIQSVLRFYHGQIITGGNDTPIEQDEVFITGNQDDWLPTPRGAQQQGGGKDNTDLANEMVHHGNEAFWGSEGSQKRYC